MYKIEFNEEMTLEGILDSFKNLKEAEIEAYIEINGIRICSKDENFEEQIKEEYTKYHEKDKKIIEEEQPKEVKKEIDKEVKIAGEECYDFFSLQNNKEFLFELSTVLEYTKEEYKNVVITSAVYNYGPTNYKKVEERDKHLNYEATILLILDAYDNDARRRLEIMKIINDVSTDVKEYTKFHFALDDVIRFTTRGEELKKLLCLDILDKPTEAKKQAYEKIKKDKQS
ncbi:MAG: hypothetical protein IK137_00330 [Bacilli bacterium]|nr:hypothetical protein [Bacilli bacterium]